MIVVIRTLRSGQLWCGFQFIVALIVELVAEIPREPPMLSIRHIAPHVALCSLFVASVGWAANADQAFRDGNELLTSGNLRGALKSYARALQEDRANAEYAQQFMLVRRVLQLEDALSKEIDKTQRLPMCQSLRTFYVSYGLHDRALAFDKEVFESLGTANAAIQLAETHLALKQEAAAVRLLETLDDSEANLATKALLAVALARDGRLDPAREIAARMTDTEGGPGTLYILARMRAAVGQDRDAVTTLKKCFTQVPPSRLESLKSHAESCADFASLASTQSFVEALKTESQVAESSCSGGSSCGSCPMRGSCSGSQGH
jgi:tetratricopeptide (TPR) repeat protein